MGRAELFNGSIRRQLVARVWMETAALAARYGPGGAFWAAHPELPQLPTTGGEVLVAAGRREGIAGFRGRPGRRVIDDRIQRRPLRARSDTSRSKEVQTYSCRPSTGAFGSAAFHDASRRTKARATSRVASLARISPPELTPNMLGFTAAAAGALPMHANVMSASSQKSSRRA